MASKNPGRPNILFILSDDQGAWAMRCAGNEEMVTPNLDRLSATGIRFDNFFCASPVCSPARASILTGRIPSQHGVQDFLRAGNATFLPNDGLEIDYIAGQPTYIELLAESGYECGLSGKWHIGHAALQRAGFSYWNVHAAGGGHYYEAPMIVNGERYQPDEYVTDVITDNALEFLNAQVGSDKPFSLNVHYTAPHAPGALRSIPGRSSTTSTRTAPSTRCLLERFIRTSLPRNRQQPRSAIRRRIAGWRLADTSPPSPRWTATSGECWTGWRRTGCARAP